MAKIVELCGSPGAGKSTLYNEMVAKWRRSSGWIPAHRLYPSAKLDFSSTRTLVISAVKKLTGKADPIAMQNAGNRFISQYPAYIDSCWNNLLYKEKVSFNGTDQRFEKAAYIHKLIQKVQFVKESGCDKVAVVDEGLINGIGSALYKSTCEEEEKEEIYHLLRQIPLPDGLVYIEGDIRENVKRLVTRKKVINSFVSLSEEELTRVVWKLRRTRQIANGLLQDMGVPVLYIDSMDSIDANTSKIMAFAEEMNQTVTKRIINPAIVNS